MEELLAGFAPEEVGGATEVGSLDGATPCAAKGELDVLDDECEDAAGALAVAGVLVARSPAFPVGDALAAVPFDAFVPLAGEAVCGEVAVGELADCDEAVDELVV